MKTTKTIGVSYSLQADKSWVLVDISDLILLITGTMQHTTRQVMMQQLSPSTRTFGSRLTYTY